MKPVLDPHGEPGSDLVALDDALDGLAKLDPRKGRVVELRFFGGLNLEETAEALGVSTDTVGRDWSARAIAQQAPRLAPGDRVGPFVVSDRRVRSAWRWRDGGGLACPGCRARPRCRDQGPDGDALWPVGPDVEHNPLDFPGLAVFRPGRDNRGPDRFLARRRRQGDAPGSAVAAGREEERPHPVATRRG